MGDFCESPLPGHPEGAERPKNLINTGKQEILRFAQDDKMALSRPFNWRAMDNFCKGGPACPPKRAPTQVRPYIQSIRSFFPATRYQNHHSPDAERFDQEPYHKAGFTVNRRGLGASVMFRNLLG